jgi:hypothetical protein
MSGNRDDYGPAGCASGCASTMAGMALLLAAFIGLVRRQRGGRR